MKPTTAIFALLTLTPVSAKPEILIFAIPNTAWTCQLNLTTAVKLGKVNMDTSIKPVDMDMDKDMQMQMTNLLSQVSARVVTATTLAAASEDCDEQCCFDACEAVNWLTEAYIQCSKFCLLLLFLQIMVTCADDGYCAVGKCRMKWGSQVFE